MELVCEGLMEPVGLYRCHGVTLKGLTIRYLRPPNSIGTVTSVVVRRFWGTRVVNEIAGVTLCRNRLKGSWRLSEVETI